MPRALKTYLTSIGFFDLAVAAPSMKAALEAWGVKRNLFHEGMASETDEPAIVKETMAKPGVVLKRAVGTKGTFNETAELPSELPAPGVRRLEPRNARKNKKGERPSPRSESAQKAAVIKFDHEKARRERKRRREEADRAKQEVVEARKAEQRQREIDRIHGQIDKARERHEKALQELQHQRDALDRKSDSEKRRWTLEKERLEDQINKL